MRLLKCCAVLILACCAALAQNAPTNQPAATTAGFDINALDKSTDACVDFYKFACGNWQKNNPLPADKARYGRFDELRERNRAILRDILEGVAKKSNRTPIEQKVGDYYSACMDTSTIDKLGTKPIEPMLTKVAGMKDKAALIETAAWLTDNGVHVLFGFGPAPDLHNANMMVANIAQGGFSLPDRDYYLKDGPREGDTKYKETREKSSPTCRRCSSCSVTSLRRRPRKRSRC
jgi:putative endopeptidase